MDQTIEMLIGLFSGPLRPADPLKKPTAIVGEADSWTYHQGERVKSFLKKIFNLSRAKNQSCSTFRLSKTEFLSLLK